jgi:hypothetical protein
MINLLQPADVCWFRTLKQKYHVLWNTWFLLGNHAYTRNDKARSLGYVKAVEWLSQIWEEFPSHIIINSYKNITKDKTIEVINKAQTLNEVKREYYEQRFKSKTRISSNH